MATLPSAVAWAPGFPHPALGSGPVGFPADDPSSDEDASLIQIAAGEGHVVAAVHTRNGTATRLMEIGPGLPPRPIETFPHGATHPTVGTDRDGRVVVVLRVCEQSSGSGSSEPETDSGDETELHDATNAGDCSLVATDLATRRSSRLQGTTGARIGAMDRGSLVTARGTQLTITPADGTATRQLPRFTPFKAPAQSWGSGSVEDLDFRDGEIAATMHYALDFGGSVLAHYSQKGGWTMLASERTGGAAIGPRNYLAPQLTATGVRAFFDGAEDAASYAGWWDAAGDRVRTVPSKPSGNPLFLRSAAFFGDRLLAFGSDDTCPIATCVVPSFGPFPVD